MSDSLPSRRELRDRERAIQERMAAEQFLSQQPAVVVPPAPELPKAHGRRAASVAPDSTPYYAPEAVPAILTPEPVAYRPAPTQISEPDTYVMPGVTVLPSIPVAREIETNTNSIILDSVPTFENSTIVVKDSNEQTRLIRTGAIDLPPLQTITGEVEIIKSAQIADQHLLAAATGSLPVSIEPQPARSFSAKKRERVFPTKLTKGKGSLHTVLATGIIMATVGTVFLTAFMLKLI